MAKDQDNRRNRNKGKEIKKPIEKKEQTQTQQQQQQPASLSISTFPDELLLLIFSHLKFTQITSVMLVCRQWHTLANDNSISKNRQKILKLGNSLPQWEPSEADKHLFNAIINKDPLASSMIDKRFFADPQQPQLCNLMIPDFIWMAIILVDRTDLLNHIIEKGQLTAQQLENLKVDTSINLNGILRAFLADNCRPYIDPEKFTLQPGPLLPLFQFATLNNALGCMRVLLDKGLKTNKLSNVNLITYYIPPPLCFAQTVAAAKLLLTSEKNPAKVNFIADETVNSNTTFYFIDATMYAAFSGNTELFRFLSSHSTYDKEMKLNNSFKVFRRVHAAIYGSKVEVLKILTPKEIATTPELLLYDYTKLTPLSLAAKLNRHDIMIYLVEILAQQLPKEKFKNYLHGMHETAIASKNAATIHLSFKLLLQYLPYDHKNHIVPFDSKSQKWKESITAFFTRHKSPAEIFITRYKLLLQFMAQRHAKYIKNLRQILLSDTGYILLTSIADAFAESARFGINLNPKNHSDYIAFDTEIKIGIANNDVNQFLFFCVNTLRQIDLAQLHDKVTQQAIRQLNKVISSNPSKDPKIVDCLKKLKLFLNSIEQLAPTASIKETNHEPPKKGKGAGLR